VHTKVGRHQLCQGLVALPRSSQASLPEGGKDRGRGNLDRLAHREQRAEQAVRNGFLGMVETRKAEQAQASSLALGNPLVSRV
jgi:hypothetical protein